MSGANRSDVIVDNEIEKELGDVINGALTDQVSRNY